VILKIVKVSSIFARKKRLAKLSLDKQKILNWKLMFRPAKPRPRRVQKMAAK
jgi:hypothetical protein